MEPLKCKLCSKEIVLDRSFLQGDIMRQLASNTYLELKSLEDDDPFIADGSANADVVPVLAKLQEKNELKGRDSDLVDEIGVFERAINEFTKNPLIVLDDDSVADAQRKFEQEESALLAELAEVQEQITSTNATLDAIAQHEKDIATHEEEFDEQTNQFYVQVAQFSDDRSALNQAIKNAGYDLDKLRRVSTLHDAFSIMQPKDSLFVQINGLRPCTAPGEPVDVDEIDAAWGQLTLLMYTLGRESGYVYTSFIPLPHGSTSKFKSCADNRLFDLSFASGRTPTEALRAFMTCVKELSDWVVRECSSRNRDFTPMVDIIDVTFLRFKFENKYDDILDKKKPAATNKLLYETTRMQNENQLASLKR